MTPQRLKAMGIALLIACIILLFIGWQQYQANEASVAMMNQMMGQIARSGQPFSFPPPMFGGRIEAGTPASTEYAVFFAILSGIGAAACLWRARRPVAPTAL